MIFTQNKEYTFREKLLEKFRACQSGFVEEFIDKSNGNPLAGIPIKIF